jgi:putative porin
MFLNTAPNGRDNIHQEKPKMKSFLWFSVLLLPMASASSAQTTSKARVRAVKGPTVSAREVQQLRDAVASQQQQMEQQRQEMEQLKSQLQQLLNSTQQTGTSAQKMESTAEQAQTCAAQAQQSATEAQPLADQASVNASDAKTQLSLVSAKTQDEDKKLSALQDLLGRFRFNGDVRVRGENFTQQGIQDRNRARLRVRFGVEGKLNEDFNAGIYLATGSLGDPTTTNETLTNNFDRKTIGLDKAFITYNPVARKWISATAGKFPYLWQRTAVTGDPDLNPEGFDQRFSFDLLGPVVKNFTVQGIELLYNESSAGQDSYALGTQASAKLQFGPWTATPSFLSLKWNRPDAILQASAFALQATTTGAAGPPAVGPFPVPGEGPGCAKVLGGPSFTPCPFAANGMTNATFIDSKGLAHFYSGFNYADFILNNQIKTGLERLPLNLLLELEDNLDAENHPLDAKGKVMPGLGVQNKEYGADFSVGQTKNKNDVQFGYAWLRQEQDADIASFGESDQRTPTNLLQHRIYALWRLRTNTLASFTYWRGRVLNSNLENNAALTQKTITTAGQQEPWLNRFQFDLIYSF